MLMQRNGHIDPYKSRTLKIFRHFVPTSDEYDGLKFLTRRNGVLMATPLLADFMHRCIYLKLDLSLVLV